MLSLLKKKKSNILSHRSMQTRITPKLLLRLYVCLTSKHQNEPIPKLCSSRLNKDYPRKRCGRPSHLLDATHHSLHSALNSRLNTTQSLYNFKTKLKKSYSNISLKLIQEISDISAYSATLGDLHESEKKAFAFRPSRYSQQKSLFYRRESWGSIGFLPLQNNFVSSRKTTIAKKTTIIKKPKINLNKMDYMLETYHRSNQDTCLIQKPAVNEGDWVQIGDLLADSASSVGGELAIGHNIIVAYMPWEGYNYEDAILINERLVYEDIYTSIHIERYEIQTRETKLGSEKITRELPDKHEKEISHLDKNGIAKIGSWVEEGDILVGKIAPKDIKQLTPQQKLLYKIFEKKLSNTKDTSLRAPKGIHANVINVNILAREKNTGFANPSGQNSDTKALGSIFSRSKKTRVDKFFPQPGIKNKKTDFLSTNKKNPLGLKKFVFNSGVPQRIKSVFSTSVKKYNQKTRWPWQTTIIKKARFAYKIVGFPRSKFSQAFKFASGFRRNTKKAYKKQFLIDKKQKNNILVRSFNLYIPRRLTLKLSNSKKFSIIRQSLNQQLKFSFKKYKFSQKQKIFAHHLKKSLYKFNTPKHLFLPYVHNSSDKKHKTYIGGQDYFTNLLKLKKIKKRLVKPLKKNKKLSRFFVSPEFPALKTKNILGCPTYVHIYLAEKRKIVVGDKMAGRHGNKGIVSRILPRQDMPFLPDGSSIDIVLNPLGVPSRMNVGQIYECLLGLAGRYLGEHYKIPPFDEVYGADASRSFVLSKLYNARKQTGLKWLFDPNNPGKMRIFDGRNSQPFHQTVTVGVAYVLKLVHMVDDKLHARSVGPYSLVTQQPLRGRSKQGGQRLGEMEVWAIEGYGAAFVLSEMLTLKSDDMTGRQNLWKNLIEHNSISLGSPESFKVLVCELQALCLDIGLFKKTLNKKLLDQSSLQETTAQKNVKEIPTLIEIDSLLHLA